MLPLRPLGSTGLEVSAIAFGAGPVSGLMTGDDRARQRAVLRRALDAGINWIDTAATYGDGASETSVGSALGELGARNAVHVATKVRLDITRLDDLAHQVTESLEGSLRRLQLSRVTLLQLHNSITRARGDEPTSLSPHDVLRAGGVADAFQRLQTRGLVDHLGLTGIGQGGALAEVIDSGRFATIQTPYNLLNPSAGQQMPGDFDEANYDELMSACARQSMGVFAIRVFAGGALAGSEPSAHTYQTKFFPLDLYRRDQARAAWIAEQLRPLGMGPPEAAVRFSLSHPQVSAALIGFGTSAELDEAVGHASRGPLGEELRARLAWWERGR
ncbi:MAG: aldo/keto reductase [Pirellulales bacterium]|nr:aldo/keto reductase [Pirellulales bacterium]